MATGTVWAGGGGGIGGREEEVLEAPWVDAREARERRGREALGRSGGLEGTSEESVIVVIWRSLAGISKSAGIAVIVLLALIFLCQIGCRVRRKRGNLGDSSFLSRRWDNSLPDNNRCDPGCDYSQ